MCIFIYVHIFINILKLLELDSLNSEKKPVQIWLFYSTLIICIFRFLLSRKICEIFLFLFYFLIREGFLISMCISCSRITNLKRDRLYFLAIWDGRKILLFEVVGLNEFISNTRSTKNADSRGRQTVKDENILISLINLPQPT